MLRPSKAPPSPKGDAKAALAAIRDVPLIGSARIQARHFLAERRGARPSLLRFEKRFIADMERLGVPVYTHNMVRDALQQNALFERGVSKAKAGSSPHNYGLALDVVHAQYHWEMSIDQWAIFGHVGKEAAKALGLDMEWGGDWKFYDPAHWQFREWKQMKEGFPYEPET